MLTALINKRCHYLFFVLIGSWFLYYSDDKYGMSAVPGIDATHKQIISVRNWIYVSMASIMAPNFRSRKFRIKPLILKKLNFQNKFFMKYYQFREN